MADDGLNEGCAYPEVLDGWSRYGDWTYIAYRDGVDIGLVRLTDADALGGVPAQHLITAGADEVRGKLGEYVTGDEDLSYEVDRPDGTSFLVVGTTMYAIAASASGRILVLELTDYDLCEGEMATIVFSTDDIDKARDEFKRVTVRRQSGQPPIAGRLPKGSPLQGATDAVKTREPGEFVVRERCSRCGANIIVGATHDCR